MANESFFSYLFIDVYGGDEATNAANGGVRHSPPSPHRNVFYCIDLHFNC